jgi:predicted 2-oxoglutarate/Fe(II)-dependent dioxygenase YbiX
MPKLPIRLPNTMPGAKPLTKSQRTAFFLWWARTLDTLVKMMVAMDVAIAIFTARSALTPR